MDILLIGEISQLRFVGAEALDAHGALLLLTIRCVACSKTQQLALLLNNRPSGGEWEYSVASDHHDLRPALEGFSLVSPEQKVETLQSCIDHDLASRLWIC